MIERRVFLRGNLNVSVPPVAPKDGKSCDEDADKVSSSAELQREDG